MPNELPNCGQTRHNEHMAAHRNSLLGRWFDELPGARPPSVDARPASRPVPTNIGLLAHSLSDHREQIVDAVARVAHRVDARLMVRRTSASSPGTSQIQEFLTAGADAVVVAGGDGTVRLAAGVLARAGAAAPSLGVIDAGSGNVLASALGLRHGTLAHRARTAVLGRTIAIDVGWASCTDDTGAELAAEPFCTMVGAGRDALTVQAAGRRSKHALGPLAYGVAGMGQVVRRAMPMEWQVDQGEWRLGPYWSVLVTNTPLLPSAGLVPGGAVLAGAARMDDGLLDVVAAQPRNLSEWLSIAASGVLNMADTVHGLQRAQGRTVAVRATSPVPVQADGDVICAAAEALSVCLDGQVAIRVQSQ